MNACKSRVRVFRRGQIAICGIRQKDQELEVVDQFRYLERIVQKDGDISERMYVQYGCSERIM